MNTDSNRCRSVNNSVFISEGILEKKGPKDIAPAIVAQIKTLLGREPRGLEAVEVVDYQGAPSVIRVASLVDDKPFPTMYWLVDKQLKRKTEVLEILRPINKELNSVELDKIIHLLNC